MPELRELQRKLDSVKSLNEVVSAMRNLAAIYVRRAESTLDAIRPYSEVIETALGVVLARQTEGERYDNDEAKESGGKILAVVFASDQGLCGTYNERVVSAALDFAKDKGGLVSFATVGRRGRDLLTMRGETAALAVPAPTSLEGIRTRVSDLTTDILGKYAELTASGLFFVFNAYEGMGRFKERVRRVLPPELGQLEMAKSRGFRYEPILTAAPSVLLGPLIKEYLFVELYRALLESHSSENGARLLAMTSAASNIDKRSIELTQEYQSARQDWITSELLDVVGGAEALRSSC